MSNIIEATCPIIADNSYPPLINPNYRYTVRAFGIFNKRIYLTRYSGSDLFGLRKYVETAGGGIEETEDQVTALSRELKEELGAEGSVIQYLGRIGIEYYLINRIDIADMYLFKIKSFSGVNRTEMENSLRQHVISLTLPDLLDIYLHPDHKSIEPLVYQRDIYYLQKNFDLIQKLLSEDKDE